MCIKGALLNQMKVNNYGWCVTGHGKVGSPMTGLFVRVGPPWSVVAIHIIYCFRVEITAHAITNV